MLAPLKGDRKSGDDAARTLPITEETRHYFDAQLVLQNRQKALATSGGYEYIDNDLVVAKANGIP